MTMPINLFLQRHGNSEGNKAQDLLKQGKIGLDHPIFQVPDHKLRLTDLGVSQAIAAGEWFRSNFNQKLFGFCSPFVRTQETAFYLGLGTSYRRYYALVERSWADYNRLSNEDRERISIRKEIDPLYTAIANGHSLHDLTSSNQTFFHTLHRKFSEKNVIAVCHGERMWSIRYMLERMSDTEFESKLSSQRKSDKIRNCQIIHYTRQNPVTGEFANHMNWMRSFCPWDLREKDLKWKEIRRNLLVEDDFKVEVQKAPRFLESFDDVLR